MPHAPPTVNSERRTPNCFLIGKTVHRSEFTVHRWPPAYALLADYLARRIFRSTFHRAGGITAFRAATPTSYYEAESGREPRHTILRCCLTKTQPLVERDR
jgi:hypothetical protein